VDAVSTSLAGASLHRVKARKFIAMSHAVYGAGFAFLVNTCTPNTRW
jgi:hypothetical protein